MNCTDIIPASQEPKAVDNCDNNVTIVYLGESKINTNCIGNYTIVRKWQISDNCNNETIVSQNIIVKDASAPVFTNVPSNVTVECDAIPDVINPTANDNCSQNNVNVVFTQEL